VIKANPRKNFLVTKLLKQLLKTRDKNIAKIVKKQILEKVELSNIFKSIELDLFEEVNLLEVELGDNINFLSNNVGRELILLLEETSISDIRDLLEISLCLLGSGVIGPIFNLLISDISREKKVFYSAVLTSDLEIEPLMLKRMYFKFIKTIKKSNSEYSSFLIEFGFTILTKEEFWSLFQYGEYILKLEKALNYDIYLLVPEGMHDEMVLYVGIEDLKITELYIEGLVGNDTGQPIVTLPSCIKDIKTLRKIYILSSGLYRIPNWIDQLLNLEEIYISHNNLQLITATIGNLNQLKVLEIKWEIQLNQLPDSIKNLNTLEILNLIGLKFQEVPCSIRSLTNLRELSLINCSNLAKLPIWISELSNLESLYIKGTRIKEIPDSCVGIVKDLDPGA
jgi:Leucine-rich repeat (LRR) protein